MMLYHTPTLELLYPQQAWEKVLDASNRDDGVLEVRLGAIMKQMMLYRTPMLKSSLPAPPTSKQTP